MSDSRRPAAEIADAIAAARDNLHTARTAARLHARRNVPTWPAHITDLDDLCHTVEALSYLFRDLTDLLRDLESATRTRYLDTPNGTPTYRPWPRDVTHAAQHTGSALITLRRHIMKTPITGTHRALAGLRADVRHAHHHH